MTLVSYPGLQGHMQNYSIEDSVPEVWDGSTTEQLDQKVKPIKIKM